MIRIDMEIPSCCIMCPIYNGEYNKCNLIASSYDDWQSYDPFEERRNDCPIKEIEE